MQFTSVYLQCNALSNVFNVCAILWCDFCNHGRRTQGERASDRRVQAQRSSPTANKGGSIARRNE